MGVHLPVISTPRLKNHDSGTLNLPHDWVVEQDFVPNDDFLLTAHGSKPAGRNFPEYNIGWLEEPLWPDDVEGYGWLRDRSPVPIAGGEEECGRQSFAPLIDRRALDVYQVDLSRNGFTESAYIRQRVEEIGARLCNWNF